MGFGGIPMESMAKRWDVENTLNRSHCTGGLAGVRGLIEPAQAVDVQHGDGSAFHLD